MICLQLFILYLEQRRMKAFFSVSSTINHFLVPNVQSNWLNWLEVQASWDSPQTLPKLFSTQVLLDFSFSIVFPITLSRAFNRGFRVWIDRGKHGGPQGRFYQRSDEHEASPAVQRLEWNRWTSSSGSVSSDFLSGFWWDKWHIQAFCRLFELKIERVWKWRDSGWADRAIRCLHHKGACSNRQQPIG